MTDETSSRDTYHHGNLRNALIDQGSKLLAEKGPEGFSMREVARRADVSVAAPAHHFGNTKGLFTAIAAQGLEELANCMELAAKAARSSEERVVAMCQAYRALGVNEPGYAAIMFRVELLDESDPRFQEQASRAFDLFAETLKQAASRSVDEVKISYAARMLWATMHGLVDLDIMEDREADELIRFSVSIVLAGIR